MSSVRKMRPGLWTGFYLEEKRACTLENLVENICRLRVSGFECAELDERNAYALFVACDKDTARENVRLLQRCVNKASEYGIRVALENQIYPVDMDYYLSEIPELCANIDFAHAIAAGFDLYKLIDRCKGRLAGLHVSDSDGRPEDYHIMPGKGLVNWKKAIEHIANAGYSGDFHLEIVHERSMNIEENDKTSALAYEIISRILKESENGQ